ncbi:MULTISPECIES: hypothetical protein [Streptomyces]|uniref:Tox-REase-5 domain-containing protein n=1 Tax=Streptomyces luteosporeus TaxID=173856 RepID=A0ABN3TRN2_9ACTN
MIDLSKIPTYTGNLESLETHASTLKTTASNIRGTGKDVHSAFQALGPSFDTPHTEQLLQTTAPVRDKADDFAKKLETVSGALSTFATTAKPLVEKMNRLRSEAEAFVKENKGDGDWKKDQKKVDKNEHLVHEVGATWAAFQAAERDAANKITALVKDGTHFVVDDGSHKAGMYGFKAEDVAKADETPWGTVDKREYTGWRAAWEWTKDNVGGALKGFFVDGVWGSIKGLGNMVGFGGWDKFKETWKGIGDIGGGISAYIMTPYEWVMDKTFGPTDHSDTDRQKAALRNFGKSMVAWDEWGKDPSRAFGTVLFNAVTLGSGTALKLGRAGEAGRLAAGAKVLTTVGRIGEIADPMTYVGKAAGVTKIKVGDFFNGLKESQSGLSDLGRSLPDAKGVHPGDISVPPVHEPNLTGPGNPAPPHTGDAHPAGTPATPPHGGDSRPAPAASGGAPSTPPHAGDSRPVPAASGEKPSVPPHGGDAHPAPSHEGATPSTPSHGGETPATPPHSGETPSHPAHSGEGAANPGEKPSTPTHSGETTPAGKPDPNGMPYTDAKGNHRVLGGDGVIRDEHGQPVKDTDAPKEPHKSDLPNIPAHEKVPAHETVPAKEPAKVLEGAGGPSHVEHAGGHPDSPEPVNMHHPSDGAHPSGGGADHGPNTTPHTGGGHVSDHPTTGNPGSHGPSGGSGGGGGSLPPHHGGGSGHGSGHGGGDTPSHEPSSGGEHTGQEPSSGAGDHEPGQGTGNGEQHNGNVEDQHAADSEPQQTAETEKPGGSEPSAPAGDRVNEPLPELTPEERAAHWGHLEEVEKRAPEDFEHLKHDPDHRGEISDSSMDEARVGLDLREQGRLPADIRRPAEADMGEFYSESTGKYYDIKGLHSFWPPFNNVRNPALLAKPFPGAYNPAKLASRQKWIDTFTEQIVENKRIVVVDVRNANQAAIDSVKEIVESHGWGDHVIWYP